jgi:hypothetical protein
VRTVDEPSEAEEEHLCDCSIRLRVVKRESVEGRSRTVVIQVEAEMT